MIATLILLFSLACFIMAGVSICQDRAERARRVRERRNFEELLRRVRQARKDACQASLPGTLRI